ncbi:dihydrolipoyllysine-residue succinyltransferase [Candidatus Anaplasma sp. TIGMIC]|uniref:dihydrolipoyllysine-residue succinyltransferase n=1 Tax=Candidatus Anaplasma sp. TIGMIC TaxID=3020713 RepID=UPI00232F078A|nr:dihydrolipoyllysine-residue succinyltransferase [Candidatus Anaplasma sp. TIGMIC]MDB1135320.1 dihydrolipoyllysine-residue succinyltransferase [Candidatus Anaplasma sp. TIGMIC]
MGDTVEVKAENLGGESILEAPVRVLKNAGDFVSAEEVLFIVETDKTSLEISSPVSGVIRDIRVVNDGTITKGQVLATVVRQEAAEKPVEKVQPSQGEAVSSSLNQGNKVADTRGGVNVLNKGPEIPSVESFVAGLHSSPASRATGSVCAANVGSSQASKVPARDLEHCHGNIVGERRVKMSKIRQVIAARLKESQNTAATLSTFNEVDMSRVMDLRSKYKDAFTKRYDVKLGFMSFFIKAVVLALEEIPVLNAEISGNEIVYKDYCNIGVAVGTDKGLVVPVIRRADSMTLAEMEQTLVELSTKARSGKLSVADMSGATFTITNGGVYGSLLSTPIINPPQSGILGMHAIQERPVVIDGKIEIRPMMYIALSYDHRIVDGQGAVTFLVRVKQYIEDPNRMALGI